MNQNLTTYKNGYKGNCPACGYKNCFSVKETPEGKILVYCHACQAPDLFEQIVKQVANSANSDKYIPDSFSPYANSKPKNDPHSPYDVEALAKRFWGEGRSANNTLVATYLTHRGVLPSESLPSVIRFHPALSYEQGTHYPAMVASVTNWQGKWQAIHRTFLAMDGSGKAPVKTAKKSLGPLKGGSVHLAPATEVLGLSEGIETGLAAMSRDSIPVWACLSTGGLIAVELPPLPLAKNVTIFADNDPPGLNAAQTLAKRLLFEGRTVTIKTPTQVNTDFADLVGKEP